MKRILDHTNTEYIFSAFVTNPKYFGSGFVLPFTHRFGRVCRDFSVKFRDSLFSHHGDNGRIEDLQSVWEVGNPSRKEKKNIKVQKGNVELRYIYPKVGKGNHSEFLFI